ncbi:SDR family oxidoreductase [Halieaceae bacterium IMCC14734]|uniref:SDR family oxidoreductase n=1 Tax=Candidatus Litorirhabdus singularis TaxID=2518993 RepID=A0ABT3TF05_9GAMM|nr:SDR family oxidoreductase [Candidatus Litorirhabdus singularis]MCX2980893.1 SDR family oxidoreductase [Candidatus Litorirhabdus singularis]
MTFNKRSTADQVTEDLDLSGQVAVITGVNSGLGLETMRVLAARGAHIIGLARTLEKANEACAGIDGETTPLACELSDLASVRECGLAIKAMGVPIDMLILNAGIMAPRELTLANGVEMQFATNHLGHFLLLQHLLEPVKQAKGRIVILSSAAHMTSNRRGIDFDNLDAGLGYDAWRFYGQSKLANLMTAKALVKRLEGTGVTANALHPGIIRTNLGRDAGGFLIRFISIFAGLIEKTIPQGSATQCYVAAHPDLDGVTGEYFSDCKRASYSKHADNEELVERLWQESEKMVAEYL